VVFAASLIRRTAYLPNRGGQRSTHLLTPGIPPIRSRWSGLRPASHLPTGGDGMSHAESQGAGAPDRL